MGLGHNHECFPWQSPPLEMSLILTDHLKILDADIEPINALVIVSYREPIDFGFQYLLFRLLRRSRLLLFPNSDLDRCCDLGAEHLAKDGSDRVSRGRLEEKHN